MASVVVPRRLSPWLIGSVALAGVAGAVALALALRPVPAPKEQPLFRTFKALPVTELSRYAGNEACASCHQKEAQAHAGSPHVHAMSRVDAASHGVLFRRPSDVKDPKQGILYRTAVENGRCILVAATEQGPVVAEAEYGFGSGKNGITYLGRQGDAELELRLSYYPKGKRWAFSPGQQLNSRSGGMVLETGLIKPAETVESCFVCHSTVIAKEKDQLLPGTCMMGVGCEACHGPGQEHIAAVRRGDADLRMLKLGQVPGQRLTQELCGQCHRSPAHEDLSDAFSRSQLPRLQGLALSQSLCFTNSEGRLSCLTCHDPHDQSPKPESYYNGKCMSCHSGASPEQHACRVEPRGDCVSCHMPAQPVGMPFGLRYRTHWIKVWSGR